MKTSGKYEIGLLAVLFIGVFGLVKISGAAMINASSCSSDDVSSAIASASARDTISVPAGNCTWASAITLGNKIQLIGAGETGETWNTDITCSSGYCISSTSADNVRISGFKFSNTVFNTDLIHLEGVDWRVDHNYITSTAFGQAVYSRSTVNGVYAGGW